jgi:hypothetical protein
MHRLMCGERFESLAMPAELPRVHQTVVFCVQGVSRQLVESGSLAGYLIQPALGQLWFSGRIRVVG